MLAIRLATVAAAACMLIACGSIPGGSGGTPSTAPGGHVTVARDTDNGKIIDVRVGDRLEVRLGSTYWTFTGSSDPAILKAAGPVQVSPQPNGCVPGGGCGIVTATFDVVGAGTAQVTASRTSCGEAMGCTGEEGSFRLTVKASAA